jgi:hypothetical protein
MKSIDTFNKYVASVIYQNFLNFQKRKIILYDGSEFDDDIDVKEFTFFDMLDLKYVQETFIGKYKTPHIISSVIGSTPQLENLFYDNETIEYLNKFGLHIFQFDVITFDILPAKHFRADSLDPLIHAKPFKNAIVGFENYLIGSSSTFCYEFESIKKFIKNNRLTNVTVFVHDYKISEFIQHRYPEFKIETKSVFQCFLFSNTVRTELKGYEYNPSLTVNNKTTEYVDRKFLSFNKRYTGYRHIIAADLITRSSYVSFDKDTNDLYKVIDPALWFSKEKWKSIDLDLYRRIKKGLDIIENSPPFYIDINISNIQHLDEAIVPRSVYQRSFCSIIAESKFAHPTGFITDKTIESIKHFKPFVLAAPPYSLEYLHSIGIKTFDKYWDESYDKETNHEKRLVKVLKLIDYVDSFSLADLKEIYQDMIPLLEHNYKVIAIESKHSKYTI